MRRIDMYYTKTTIVKRGDEIAKARRTGLILGAVAPVFVFGIIAAGASSEGQNVIQYFKDLGIGGFVIIGLLAITMIVFIFWSIFYSPDLLLLGCKDIEKEINREVKRRNEQLADELQESPEAFFISIFEWQKLYTLLLKNESCDYLGEGDIKPNPYFEMHIKNRRELLKAIAKGERTYTAKLDNRSITLPTSIAGKMEIPKELTPDEEVEEFLNGDRDFSDLSIEAQTLFFEEYDDD